MRIAKFFSPSPSGRKAYARGFRHSASITRLVAVAATLLLLSATSLAAPSATTSRPLSGAESLPGESFQRKKKYNCASVDGQEIPTFSDDALEEGIKEAKRLLQTCPACRQFFGATDPVKRLEELEDMDAIIVSEISPGDRGPNAPWPFVEFPQHELGTVAAVVYLNPLLAAKDRQPCIYVNRHNFLGSDVPHESEPFDGLSLVEARGVAVLHELAHIMSVIPSDGVFKVMKGGKVIVDKKASRERSIQNTWCIRDNCRIPCAEQCSCCPGKSPCKPSHRRCPPLAPAKRGSIIKKFQRLSNLGLALVS